MYKKKLVTSLTMMVINIAVLVAVVAIPAILVSQKWVEAEDVLWPMLLIGMLPACSFAYYFIMYKRTRYEIESGRARIERPSPEELERLYGDYEPKSRKKYNSRRGYYE